MNFSCEECRIGRLHPTRATYIQPLGEQFLIFPQAPALRCDVCGALEFDSLFADMMEVLIADHMDYEPADLFIQTLVLGAAGNESPRFKMM